MRRAIVLLFAALATAACAPSVPHLVQQRRFADAICFASNEQEARLVAASVWQAVDPKVHVHVVSPQEWALLLGEERGAQAGGHYLAFRTSWAGNAVSVDRVALSVDVLAPRAGHDDLHVIDTATYEQRAIAAAATGERIPSQRTSTVHESWTPAPPRDPLGAILSLFVPTSSSHEVVIDPSDAEYAQAGPAAWALMSALIEGENATGYVLRGEDRLGAEMQVELRLEDHLEGSGSCTLHVTKVLSLTPADKSFARQVEAEFRRGYRPVSTLEGATRAWLSNDRGGWGMEL